MDMDQTPAKINRPVVQIAGTQVQQISYKGEPVVTFAMVDEVHQRTDGTARRNFNDNRERFEEGRDFITLNQPNEIRSLGFTRPQGGTPASVVLLTERGYLKLVKPMQDDRAWQVQGEMIDCYFKVKEVALASPPPSPALSREARLQFKQLLWLAKQLKQEGNQAILAANRATRALTGVDMMGLMGIQSLPAPEPERLLNPTEIGLRLGGRKAKVINLMLITYGYQVDFRDAKGNLYYEPTEKGRAAGGTMVDTEKAQKHGTPVRQLRWASRIVDLLNSELANEVAA